MNERINIFVKIAKCFDDKVDKNKSMSIKIAQNFVDKIVNVIVKDFDEQIADIIVANFDEKVSWVSFVL